MSDKNKATILLILMAVIWGAGYIGVQDAINSGWGSFSILFVRFLIGSLAITPFILKDKSNNIEMYLGGALCGLCGFLGLAFQIFGQRLTTVSNTSFITSLYIVFTPIFTWLFYKRKEPFTVFVAIALSVAGCFFLNFNLPFTLDKENLTGNLLVLIGAIFFALQIIFIAKFTQKYNVLKLTCIELYSMSFYALLGMIFTNDYSMKFDFSFVEIILVGIFSSGLASVLQMYGNKHLNESVAGIIMGLESVFGAIFACLCYQQELANMNIIKIIGCILIFLGACVCQIKVKNKNNTLKEDEKI